MTEVLILFVLALLFGGPIALILVLARHRTRLDVLGRHQAELEGELAVLRHRVAELAARGIAPTPAAEAPPAVAAEPVAATAPPTEGTPPAAEPVPEPAPAAEPAPFGATPWAVEPAGAPAPPALPAAPRESLEARLLSRLPVWIGSLALFLAGAYLVKFTVDHALLGPTARVAIGILFGASMLVGGEWLRRRSAIVAAGLSAAGIADLYACFLAATSLYALVSRPLGFGLMALTTAAAVLLALRHGPLIAVLGLVGGFVTPALIGSKEPNAAGLFAYLLLLQLGILAVARGRRWWPIAALTLAGGALWSLVWMVGFFRPGDGLPLGLFLLATAAAFVAASWRRGDTASGTAGTAPDFRAVLRMGSPGLVLVLMSILVGVGHFSTLEWCFAGLLAAGLIVLARLDAQYEPLAWLASAAGLVLLYAWTLSAATKLPGSFTWIAAGYGGLVACGAYAALWGSWRPARWATLSAASAFLYFLVTWAGRRATPPSIGWGAVSLALAAVAVIAALPLARRRAEGRSFDEALAAVAVAATLFVSAAVPLELDRFVLTVAWALEVAALAFIEERLRVRPLRALAGLLGGLALARLLLNPFVFDYPPGTTPLFNWILFGYGLTAAALALAAWIYRRFEATVASDLAEGGSILATLALVGLEVRHYFHVAPVAGAVMPGLLWRGDLQVAEAGAVVVLWLLFGWALLAWNGRSPRASLRVGGLGTIGIALAGGLFVLGLAVNPLWSPLQVGTTPLFNALLLAYGVPAALAIGIARYLARGEGTARFAPAASVAGLAYALLGITLEIRQAFHGTYLNTGSAAGAELYSYSAAYVVFGLVLLGLAIVRRGVVLRLASLAVMLLAVTKVFLWDLSELRDLYRVFSLLGLGASLLLIGYLYSRFIFRLAK